MWNKIVRLIFVCQSSLRNALNKEKVNLLAECCRLPLMEFVRCIEILGGNKVTCFHTMINQQSSKNIYKFKAFPDIPEMQI